MREPSYENLAIFLKGSCSSVQHLNMKGIWLSGKPREEFTEALKKMPQLRVLHVPNIANRQIVETLSRKCAHLTYLDISGSQEISEDDVMLLSSLRASLQIVNLSHAGSCLPSNCIAELIGKGNAYVKACLQSILAVDIAR